MKNVFLVLALITFVHFGFSQSLVSKGFNNFSIDLYSGLNSFHGDIKSRPGFILGGKLNWHITNSFGIYSSVNYSSLNGWDKIRDNRFSNNTTRVMFGAETYLFNVLNFKSISNRVQPVLGVGVGGVKSFFSKVEISEDNPEIINNTWALNYNISGALKIKLTQTIDMQAKIGFFFSRTDFLDNYKPNFIANKKNDAFNEYTIGITYHFGASKKDAIIWKRADYDNKKQKAKPEKKHSNTKPLAPKDLENDSKEIESDAKKVIIKQKEAQKTKVKISPVLFENEFDCIIKY